MALDDLIKHIESEAHAEIEKIRSDVQRQFAEIEKRAEESRQNLKESYEKKLAEAKKRKLDSALTNARIKSRIDTLNLKRSILDEFYVRLYERVASLDEESKKRIYIKILSTVKFTENAKLLVSKKEAALWKKIKTHLKKAKVEEMSDFEGGFILKTENAVFDYTIENIFKNFRQATEIKTARKLFPEK